MAAGATDPGTVYLVLGSDTAVWNWPGGVNVYVHTNHFNGELYTDPKGRAHQAMDPSFRAQFTDSFGSPLKLTWWMLVGSVYGHSDNHDVPVPNLMPLHLMRQYHGDSIRALGDELTLHYHTFLWSDYNGDGTSFWNEARTFHECRSDFDLAIAQSLIEEEVFTVTFRSGWHFMDNEWQNYSAKLWPYNMDNDSPNRSAPVVEPLFNSLDWSQAPLDFVPFHPATTNYQVAGDSPAWNVRSVKMPNVTQSVVDAIFAAAAKGTNQVVSFWAHLPEANFLDQIARMDLLAHVAATNQPAVKFRYCTAVEAMQRWRGIDDVTPPQLEVTESDDNGIVTLHLRTDEPLFQPEPFVATKDIFERCRIVTCVPEGPNAWSATVPLLRGSLAKIGIAVTDRAGNLTTRLIRYVPDDRFVDNLDAGYSETAGAWTNSATAAWGIDSRIVRLPPGESAAAQWILPVTIPGIHAVSIQVPKLTNPAPVLTYKITSGDVELAKVRFTSPLPTNDWIPLASVALDPAVTNVLTLTAEGDPVLETLAAADVVRVSPLLRRGDFIRGIRVMPGETTANLLWTTASPASTRVEWGEDIRYGRGTVTNSQDLTNHVVTLTGLSSGTVYPFQIICRADGLDHTAQGELIPAPDPAHLLGFIRSGSTVSLYWNGEGFTLQRSRTLDPVDSAWEDMTESPTTSPWAVTGSETACFRLRQ